MVCKQAEFDVTERNVRVFETFLIRTAEVYLNKAEAASHERGFVRGREHLATAFANSLCYR